jgi:ABC-type multidrug transport system ATPase subunit
VLDIDELVIEDGERVLISGNNGSGKTTLLKVIAGIATVDRPGALWRTAAIAETAGAFVPQTGGLYPNLTVQQNLLLRCRLYGLPVPPDSWVGEFFESFGLVPFLHRRYADLSGGYQRMASIAVSLQTRPSWLFLDEPFSGVDERNRATLTAALERVGLTLRLLIMTTPETLDTSLVKRHIHLQDGRIV